VRRGETCRQRHRWNARRTGKAEWRLHAVIPRTVDVSPLGRATDRGALSVGFTYTATVSGRRMTWRFCDVNNSHVGLDGGRWVPPWRSRGARLVVLVRGWPSRVVAACPSLILLAGGLRHWPAVRGASEDTRITRTLRSGAILARVKSPLIRRLNRIDCTRRRFRNAATSRLELHGGVETELQGQGSRVIGSTAVRSVT